MRHASVLWLIVPALVVWMMPIEPRAQAASDWLTRFNAWTCKTVGYGCPSNAIRFAAHRSLLGERPNGGSLTLYDMKTRSTRVLWADCGCWSVVPYGAGALAVAADEGIVLVPITNPQSRKTIFRGAGVRELVGTELTADHRLLFLRSTTSPSCTFEPWELHPGDLEANAASLAELACGDDSYDYFAFVRPAQVSSAGTLVTSQHAGTFTLDLHTSKRIRALFDDYDAGGPDRFDPIWIDRSSIVFIARARS